MTGQQRYFVLSLRWKKVMADFTIYFLLSSQRASCKSKFRLKWAYWLLPCCTIALSPAKVTAQTSGGQAKFSGWPKTGNVTSDSDGSTSKTTKPVARRCHSKIAYMWLHLYRQIQHTFISASNARAGVAKLFLLHLTWAFNSAPCIRDSMLAVCHCHSLLAVTAVVLA